MNKFHSFAKAGLATVLLATGSAVLAASANDVLPEIKAIAAKPEVIAAVKAQNAQSLSIDAIKAMDGKWIAASGGLPEGKAMMDSPTSKALLAAEKAKRYFTETILTDNQGANVAISAMTSDYWQGDEIKYQQVFAQPVSHLLDSVRFDASSQRFLVQLTVPVNNAQGEPLGALTLGLDVELSLQYCQRNGISPGYCVD